MHPSFVHALAVCLAGLLTQDAIAQRPSSDPLTSVVETPLLWRSFNWSQAKTSSLWMDKRWKPSPTDTEQPDDATHVRSFSALGTTWNARLRSQSQVDKLSIAADVSASKCPDLVTAFGKTIGEAIFSDDTLATYFSETSFFKLVFQKYQWTQGTTRIDAACVGSQASAATSSPNDAAAEPFFLNITFSPADQTPVLQPTFMLRCTRKSVMLLGQADERTYSDLVFLVDIANKKIKNPRFAQISEDGTASIDDSEIIFTISTNKNRIKHRVDRITGTLSAELMEGDKTLARVSGNCERVSSTKKF